MCCFRQADTPYTTCWAPNNRWTQRLKLYPHGVILGCLIWQCKVVKEMWQNWRLSLQNSDPMPMQRWWSKAGVLWINSSPDIKARHITDPLDRHWRTSRSHVVTPESENTKVRSKHTLVWYFIFKPSFTIMQFHPIFSHCKLTNAHYNYLVRFMKKWWPSLLFSPEGGQQLLVLKHV